MLSCLWLQIKTRASPPPSSSSTSRLVFLLYGQRNLLQSTENKGNERKNTQIKTRRRRNVSGVGKDGQRAGQRRRHSIDGRFSGAQLDWPLIWFATATKIESQLFVSPAHSSHLFISSAVSFILDGFEFRLGSFLVFSSRRPFAAVIDYCQC